MKKKNKKVIEIEIVSYGLYTEWERENSDLPKFLELTQVVEAEIGVEFGMIVEIRKARGRYLDFLIEHPPFFNDKGEMEPSFKDTFRVKHNPFHFFLGDTVWEPIEDKKGDWTLSILDGDEVLVSKAFRLI